MRIAVPMRVSVCMSVVSSAFRPCVRLDVMRRMIVSMRVPVATAHGAYVPTVRRQSKAFVRGSGGGALSRRAREPCLEQKGFFVERALQLPAHHGQAQLG